jgi:ubiquinone/menaquinone biosynthesis C-methylase UbiE
MAYDDLKQRQSVWSATDIHEHVIARLAPHPGQHWLDLACGTGAVAERAAARGAWVTGIDPAPALTGAPQ